MRIFRIKILTESGRKLKGTVISDALWGEQMSEFHAINAVLHLTKEWYFVSQIIF